MKKHQTLISFILIDLIFILSCQMNPNRNSSIDYPPEVKKLGVQTFYKIAIQEMYKLNMCCDCNCLARGENRLGLDTLNILNLDLKLEKLVSKNDTTTFIFSYYSIVQNDTVYYYPFSESWTSCLYNGISFKGNNLTPFPLNFGDARILEIEPTFIKEANINFERCIKNIKVSATLKKVLEKQ